MENGGQIMPINWNGVKKAMDFGFNDINKITVKSNFSN
jgi:hypothetical protein